MTRRHGALLWTGVLIGSLAAVLVAPRVAAQEEDATMGILTIDGSPAPLDTKVFVQIDGTTYGSGNVVDAAGTYFVLIQAQTSPSPCILGEKVGGVNGDTMIYWIWNSTTGFLAIANETSAFTTGGAFPPIGPRTLDLSVTTSSQPPFLRLTSLNPSGAGSDEIGLYNPSAVRVILNTNDWWLDDNDGNTASLNGNWIVPAGGTSEPIDVPNAYLNPAGDEQKLMWQDPAGLVGGGNAIAMDRVEWGDPGTAPDDTCGVASFTPTPEWEVDEPGPTAYLTRWNPAVDTNTADDWNGTASPTWTTNAPPTVTVTQPAGGDAWRAGAHDIAFTITDDLNLPNEIVIWINYSNDGGATWSPVPGAQGIPGDSSPVSWTITLPCAEGPNNVVQIEAYDWRNAQGVGTSGTFTIDCTIPNLAITSPANGAWVTSTTVTVDGTAADNLGVSLVNVSFTGGSTYVTATGTTTWTATGTAALVPGPNANIIHAFSVDAAGANSAHATISLNYDPDAPTVTITDPLDSDVVTSSPIWVNGTASDVAPGSGLDRVEVSCDNGVTWAVATSTTAWTFSACNLAVGPNVIHARVFDVAGWESIHHIITVTLQGDVTPPTATTTPNTVGVLVTDDIVITFSEAMDQPSVEASFSYSDGVTTWTIADGVGNWAGDVFTFNPTADFATCTTITVSVGGTDLATNPLNPTPTTQAFTTECFIPSASVLTPVLGSFLQGGVATTITFDLADSDDANTALTVWVNYSTDSGTTWSNVTDTAGIPGTANPNSVAWTPPAVDVPDSVLVRVEVQDPTNNFGSDNGDLFTIDSTIPMASITTPAIDGTWTGTSPVATAGTAADNFLLDEIEVSCDGGVSYTLLPPTSPWSFNCPLAPGLNVIHVHSFDRAGWESVHALRTINYDNAAPTVTITSPADGAVVTTDTVTVTGTASDGSGSGLALVQVSCDNGATWTTAGGTLSSWTYDCTLVAGTNTILVRAEDNVGHQTASPATVDVTYNAPAADQTPPTADFAWTPTTPEAGGQVSFDASASSDNVDPDANLTFAWTVKRGATTVTTLTGRTPTWTPDAEGTYNVTLVVTDRAGNIGTVSKNVTVNARTQAGAVDYSWLWLLLLLLIVAAAVALWLLMGKRKKEEEEKPPEPGEKPEEGAAAEAVPPEEEPVEEEAEAPEDMEETPPEDEEPKEPESV